MLRHFKKNIPAGCFPRLIEHYGMLQHARMGSAEPAQGPVGQDGNPSNPTCAVLRRLGDIFFEVMKPSGGAFHFKKKIMFRHFKKKYPGGVLSTADRALRDAAARQNGQC